LRPQRACFAQQLRIVGIADQQLAIQRERALQLAIRRQSLRLLELAARVRDDRAA
jgi:hypothetical protein